ncbi:hypothetical protein HWV62_5768 [Athelia sp. TMB]|nr:hypothetical protein HWV62_5768 [Athelia sp. TMB]
MRMPLPPQLSDSKVSSPQLTAAAAEPTWSSLSTILCAVSQCCAWDLDAPKHFASTKVLSIGGSRNIGYLSSVRLLEKGASVTFLLRSPSCFDTDETIQKYVKSGKARLIKGDALVKTDVVRSWAEAAQGEGEQRVDVLLFTVGTIPSFSLTKGFGEQRVDVLLFTVGTIPSFSLTKGFVQTPPNLVTQSLLNALSTIPSQAIPPKIITISSTGLTKSSHAALPLLLKPVYGHFLHIPHMDKVGAEKVAAHCAGWPWDANDGDVGADIMGEQWEETEGLPKGTLPDILVVRPALLTDGECQADAVAAKGKGTSYRVREGNFKSWTVSRKDVAHFLVEGALSEWDTWKGKCVSIGY